MTLVCASAQRTLLFYTWVLGMRLVKQTVSVDAPGTYQLYFGDAQATPGRIIAFLEWPKVPCGTRGIGGIRRLGLATPAGALDAWEQRLRGFGVPTERRGQTLDLRDPDGVELTIYAEGGEAPPGGTPPIWLGQITAMCSSLGATAQFMGEVLGVPSSASAAAGAQGFLGGGAGPQLAYQEDRQCATPRAQVGGGQSHHLSLAVPDEVALIEWRERLIRAGLHASPIIDRFYFKSLYTHDPDGLVIELATSAPGLTVDEPPEQLGHALMLPPWLEPQRAMIERVLPPLKPVC